MTINTISIDELVASYKAFQKNALIRRGISSSVAKAAVADGSEIDLKAKNLGNIVRILLANQRLLQDQAMADTATGDDLDRIANLRGVYRSPGSGASGKILIVTSGTVSVSAGQELTASKNQKRYKTVSSGNYTNGSFVDVIGIDVGIDTNLDPNEELIWTSPPPGVSSKAYVSPTGITNGKDADNDARLRKRLTDALKFGTDGGSWGFFKNEAEKASASIETAYVYPAVQGPGTVHVALTVEGLAEYGYGRAPQSALVSFIANLVVPKNPGHATIKFTGVEHEAVSLAFKMTLPNPKTEGGLGTGWIEESADRFPRANAAAPVKIASVTSAKVFQLDAVTTGTTASPDPQAGITIHFWDSANQKLITDKVYSVSGSSPNWVVTMENAHPGLAVGDYCFPGMFFAQSYLTTIQEYIAKLAPGEKTSSATVLPRAKRRPNANEGYSSEISETIKSTLLTSHSEISAPAVFTVNGSTSFTLPLTPSVPSAVTDAPKIFHGQHFGIYPA